MTIIYRSGFSTIQIRVVFLKVKGYNLLEKPTPPKLQRVLVLGKNINLERYVYWPTMEKGIDYFIRGCILYCTNMPIRKIQGLYHPLTVPTRPWTTNPWILSVVFQEQTREMTICLWQLESLARCAFSCLVKYHQGKISNKNVL